MSNLETREKIAFLFYKYYKFLTPAQYQAIYLTYIEDLSLAEIADIAATTRSAVHDALKKGKNKLIKINEQIT